MKTLKQETAEQITKELENIPEKYQKDFNSIYEGYAVILEEVRELENEVFFGEKKARGYFRGEMNQEFVKEQAEKAKEYFRQWLQDQRQGERRLTNLGKAA